MAEFIGIMMGDGGMSKYQATITLHRIDDFKYSEFVTKRIESLFGFTPGIQVRESESVIVIVMSRIALVRYLHSLSLPVGNKIRGGLDIPSWIKSDIELSVACMRGLFDTDGCIFTHRYKAKGKWYSYKKFSFTSASKPLLESVYRLLDQLGMHPRIGSQKDVRLDRVGDVKRYFELVGTSNPKHLRRYAA